MSTTIATLTSERCATRPQGTDDSFTVVSKTITFTGDFLQQFINDFESDLKENWRLFHNALKNNQPGQAALHKASIKKLWSCVIRVYDLERFMSEKYSETPSSPAVWSIYTLREALYHYWEFVFEDYTIQRKFYNTYCYNNDAVFNKLDELDDDDWLKDLWEQYGLIALKKHRIYKGKSVESK